MYIYIKIILVVVKTWALFRESCLVAMEKCIILETKWKDNKNTSFSLVLPLPPSLPPSLPLPLPLSLSLSLSLSQDDLLMRGFIGHLEEGSFLPHNHKTYLWTHLHFSFGYNKDQVVEANVSTVGATPFSLDETEPPVKVTFTYSVSWKKSL